MASLMEELIDTLEQEDAIYQQLVPISDKKTRIIIDNDLAALQEVTMREQQVVEQIAPLEKKREEIIKNIGVVLNREVETLTMSTLIGFLSSQPKEQKQLSKVHDSLKSTMKRLVDINNRNKSLIEQSLEMIEFNMNLMQSTRMLPGSNNYTKSASQFESQATLTGMFDAKQ